jgi:hypothetical protein
LSLELRSICRSGREHEGRGRRRRKKKRRDVRGG